MPQNKTQQIKEIIKTIKSFDPTDFYAALLIYDILGYDSATSELINTVKDIVDGYETIYNEELRDDIGFALYRMKHDIK